MQYRELGSPKLKVSVICLGTQEFSQKSQWWGIGKLSEYKKIVDYALDAGINFIDTAQMYGQSEEIVGELLRGRRDEVVLATKIYGFQWDYETMRKKLDESLKKLQTDYVDLYMIHWPRIRGQGEQTRGMEEKDYEDIYSSMQRLKDEGLIRTAGLSNFRLHHLKKFRDEAFETIASNQVPYNLLWRSYDKPDYLDFCRQKGLRYLAYASLAQGLLTGQYGANTELTILQRGNVLFNEPVYSRAMKVVDAVKEVAKEADATPAQVALRWIIERELTVSALVGIRRVEELKQNVEAASLHLTKGQLGRLDEASLEFWEPMPDGLEMWIPDNRHNNSLLKKIGLTWREWDSYK